MNIHLRTALATLIAASTVAACTSSGDDSTPATSTAPAPTEQSETADALNADDVMFLQGMIAHHEQALEMAEFALDPTVGAGEAVAALATRIRDAQAPEIDLMTSLLEAAGEPLTMDAEGHDMSSMAGMMSADEMDALAAMTGAEFDEEWLRMMIAHHEGALELAGDVIAAGSHPEVRTLAEAIVATQQAEIAEMQDLLGG